jgi:hypothetical protein
MLALLASAPSNASDHLDTRTVIADPRADIGDIYAWTSADGRRLNLVMTIVGHSFSPELDYTLHIGSGRRIGATSAEVSIRCRIPSESLIDCEGANDRAMGNASRIEGISSRGGHYQVFAGVRDDPFFNNVKGSRQAYQKASAAIAAGAPADGAGCHEFSAATSRDILEKWQHVDGGPATNFLAGWTPASLVIAVDLDEVTKGGPLLAVWATTSSKARQIDRMGRPLTGNALLAPLAADAVSDRLKEDYNAAAPASGEQFVPVIEKSLALYDSFDGICGNNWLAGSNPKQRYHRLAELLADDRLWVNSASNRCVQVFAVERAALNGDGEAALDCGGRTPLEDAVDVYRSLLATGRTTGISDGVDRDEQDHSVTQFPFLSAP